MLLSLPVFLLLLCCTPFIKLATTFSILRAGLGLSGAGTSAVVILLALVFSMYVSLPLVEHLLADQGTLNGGQVVATLRPFLQENTDSQLLSKVVAARQNQKTAISSDYALLPAFLLTELRESLVIGVYILVPFVFVDILVAVLCACGAVPMLANGSVTFPLKLLLFLTVDGWTLLTTRLLRGYIFP